jgi:hypothetical protein
MVWGKTESTNKPVIPWLILLAPDGEYSSVGGMRIRWETEVLGATVPLCPTQYHMT